MKIWIQTPLVISVLKRNNDELNRNNDEESELSEDAPPTSLKRETCDELPKAEKKVKHEETFDLTNDEE